MQIADDTIVAISTPVGRGGIGIVRLSGAGAKAIAEGLVRLKRPLEAGRARFGQVMDEAAERDEEARKDKNEMRGSLHSAADSLIVRETVRGSGRDDDSSFRVLDEAVVTYFAGPRSYTGEDVVEIAVHGAPVLLDALVRRCVAAGARLAGPGEFTERAFLAGRIDLTQAEAVDDLIQATTLEQARTAARQMGGGLSRQVRPVKDRLIELIAGMEAGIDFAEDDLEVMGADAIVAAIKEIEAPLAEMEKSFTYGRVLREGFRLAIVGRPNAGKSSLFNRLIRRERAIVTAQPGTTRDPVAERLEFAGIPVEVVDTAGLRETGARGEVLDEAEAMGVAKSREAMAEADVVLLVVAADAGMQEEDWEVIREFGGAPPTSATMEPSRRWGTRIDGSAGLVVVVNKVDLVRENPSDGDVREGRLCGPNGPGGIGDVESRGVLRLRLAQGAAHDSAQDDGLFGGVKDDGSGIVVVKTSAVNGTGIEELRAAVLGELRAIAPGADTAPVTNMRQHEAIGGAVRSIRAAMVGVERQVPHEMVLIDLHDALGALDTLTGTTHTEEILGIIFSRFCIGK